MTTAIRNTATTKTTGRSDAELQRMVFNELSWDIQVPTASVGVEVDNGTVTLTGTVGSYSQKLAAQKAARRVEGIIDVANDIEVKFGPHPQASDTQVTQAVRQALEADVRIPEKVIQVTVSSGYVTLDGCVSKALERYWAEQDIEHLAGVRGVINSIEVNPAPAQERDIHTAIEQAFERQAGQRAKWIDIAIKDGAATLTGTVRSWLEREAAYEAAIHAPGIQSVTNLLRIAPYA